MARLLEHTAKRILGDAGLAVPAFHVAASAEEAYRAAQQINGGCVVKALVPGGRRGKSGAVRFCDVPHDAHAAASDLLGSQVETYLVDAVLVEARAEITRELYLAFKLTPGEPSYTLLVSSAGGVEIEANTESIITREVDPLETPSPDWFASVWKAAGEVVDPDLLGQTTKQLFDVFVQRDLTLLEVNPLGRLTDSRLNCVGALMAIDDNALFRHPDLKAEAVQGSDLAARPETDRERRVSELNLDLTQRGSARYLELDGGNIGFLCGGGGASLLLFDAIVEAGGSPANYSEFGGNPTEQRVYDLARVVLSKPGVEGLFLAHNLTNNTQVDVVAAGVIRALADAGKGPGFPVVAREAGLHDDVARKMFATAGITCLGEDTSLESAARLMVAAMREAGH